MDETVAAAIVARAERVGVDRDAVLPFAERYLRRRAAPDGEDPDAVAAEVVGVFAFADDRGTAPRAVRACTPSLKGDGYETGGSILETNTADLPFLVDSVVAEAEASGAGVRALSHPIVGVRRDGAGRIVATGDAAAPDLDRESFIHIALDRRLSPEVLAELEEGVGDVLSAVRRAVTDHDAMRDTLFTLADELAEAGAADGEEAAEFLRWIADAHFVLLGHRAAGGETSGLFGADCPAGVSLEDLGPPPAAQANGSVVVRKSAARSRVHRPARLEEIRITRPDGGEDVVIGLFTSRAHSEPASRVPLLRRKLERLLQAEDLVTGSHDWKAAVALYESFPKDVLFTTSEDDLHRLVVAMLTLPPGAVRVLTRRDVDERHAALLVAVPRSSYDAGVRDEIRGLLRERAHADHIAIDEVVGEGDHVRLHVTVHSERGLDELDADGLEKAVEALARTWEDRLRDALVAAHGEERGRLLHARWTPRLPSSYAVRIDPEAAVTDIRALEDLRRRSERLAVHLRTEESAPGESLTRITVVRIGPKAELSAVMPILEDLGLRVVEERPTRLVGGEETWLQDFGVLGPGDAPLDLDACGDRVAACVSAVLCGETESDALHRLVVLTGLTHDRLEALRTYRRYRQRVGSRYTEAHQTNVITRNAQLTERLVELFEMRFDPDRAPDEDAEAAVREDIAERLDAIASLDDDRVMRNQLTLIDATLRTNAYRPGRGALAFKLRSAEVPAIPQPAPFVEIYVNGDDVEGIHIRGGRIARGGLRWSDRQDYRTEVWGLMRAQMVKNAVIVPTGAKGGFRLRHPPADPDELRARVRSGYEDFIRALLDVTDDREGDGVVPPTGVRRYDDDDPYLVVAADKGTATFSDVANAIAEQRGFWLGDAFASGGSAGYDHKALGITARGAWESVKRHFSELGVDPEADPITAVGIGDMGGDVFGNGMLRSRSLRLIAAYDHRHVFVDPDPADPEASLRERRRLFDLGMEGRGTTWDDYDRSLISPGGGVFPRTAKRVELTSEMRAALGTDARELTPAELVRAVLRAPVDLLFNGGIGTVVKAQEESDADAQDRSSDAIRVDARELRCRVIGEGGNLGFTQHGRVEAARCGILLNADFIDNSGGVDCSDHEVNLKILLGLLEKDPDDRMERAERDALLRDVTDDVAADVLRDSARQALIITHEARRSPRELLAYEDLMLELERAGLLDRRLERLPSSEDLAERRSANVGLFRPEIAVLLALAKQHLTDTLLDDPVLDDPALAEDLRAGFPAPVLARVGRVVEDHPLRRELIATRVANDVIDAHGPTFVARRTTELGVPAAAVVRGQRVARDTLGVRPLVRAVVDAGISADARWEALDIVDGAVRSCSRWVLRHAGDAPIGPTTAAAVEAADAIRHDIAGMLGTERATAREQRAEALAGRGVPPALADGLELLGELVHAPAIVRLAERTGRGIAAAAAALVAVQDGLWLSALHAAVVGVPFGGRAQRWAAQAVSDELDDLALSLAASALELHPSAAPDEAVRELLSDRSVAVERFTALTRLVAAEGTDIPGLSLVARRLRAVAEDS